MKKVLALACSAVLITLFAGCAVYTPSGAVVVDPGATVSASKQHGGGFCPPGQAKKGNC